MLLTFAEFKRDDQNILDQRDWKDDERHYWLGWAQEERWTGLEVTWVTAENPAKRSATVQEIMYAIKSSPL